MRAALLFCLPSLAFACNCMLSQSVCHETASTEVIFIGTVESVEPAFLDPWSIAQRPSLLLLNQQSQLLRDEHSASATQLQQTLRQLFPDVPDAYRAQLDAGKTPNGLVSLFYTILGQGRHARIKVKSVFRGEEDEDDTIDVWTTFDDCGIDFQPGETYLVYAEDEEEAGRIVTDRCTRTRRLTDAGADLAYLFFYRDNQDAGRLEGFVTTNPTWQRDFDRAHDPEKIAAPSPDAVVELLSKDRARYTTADSGGRFLFDGLAAGTYRVSVYEKGFPASVRKLAGPQEVDVAAKGCATAVLVAAPKQP